MIPPVDEQVKRENPQFAKLYSILTNDVLNSDCTTKHDEAAKERVATLQELDKARHLHAKHYLLERAIATASLPATKPAASSSNRRPASGISEPPDSLTDLLVALPLLIDSDEPIQPDAAALLLSSPPFTELETLLPDLAALVSANLRTSALGLARITHPTTNPSFLHRHIPSLPADHAALRNKLSETQSALVSSQLEASASLGDLLDANTQLLTLLISSLELKHGPAAESLELQALDVSLQAQQLEVDAQTSLNKINKDIYSPEANVALGNYSSHLKDAQVRTTERIRGLRAELAEYGVGADTDGSKEKTMKEMARVYREMESQLEEVKRDIERLDARA